MESSTDDGPTVGSLALRYLDNKAVIERAEANNKEIKSQIEMLFPQQDEKSTTLIDPTAFRGARVEWCKGRKTEKLDAKKLKLELMKYGVSLELLDDAFAACTESKVGEPSLRITEVFEGRATIDYTESKA